MYAVTTIQSRNQRYRMQCQKQRFLSSKLYAKFNEENRKRTEKSSPNASFRTQNYAKKLLRIITQKLVKSDVVGLLITLVMICIQDQNKLV